MAHNYWTCSKFANWLRGTDMPHAASSEEWRDWENAAKTAHPIRYWLADDGLHMLEKAVYWLPENILDLRYYINNRWVDQTHALVAHVQHAKRGGWIGMGNRMLPCLFSELVDFVEIELAGKHVIWDKEAAKKNRMPWWRRWYRSWRCADAGVAYLEWESQLIMDESWGLMPKDKNYGKLTCQAVNAIEILRLYRWWKDVYTLRPDAYDASGWTELCDRRRAENGGLDFFVEDRTDKQRRESARILKKLQKIEALYDKEDTEMMIALVKIRQSLWS